MPGRPPRPVGTFGSPSKPRRQRNGKWRTTVRHYGAWGITLLQRTGNTASEASAKLAEAMRDFREAPPDSPITRATTLTELATELLVSMAMDPACSPGLIESYRREIEVSRDKRANPNTIKIENTVGRLQIWQATTGELDRHLKRLVALGLRRKARQHKIILRALMQIAVRHDVIAINPVDGVDGFRRNRRPVRGKVTDMAALPAFRAQVRAWARGDEIPGTPGYRSGPPRDWTIVWVVDVITGTGMRPYEVFAILLNDINLDTPDPYLDVTGTLVEARKCPGGWMRQSATKSHNGWRRILLPPHTVTAIREAINDLTTAGHPTPSDSCSPHATAHYATHTTSDEPGEPHAARTSHGSPHAPSAEPWARRSTTPPETPNAPHDNSATPPSSRKRTTSTSPKQHRTTARSSNDGYKATRTPDERRCFVFAE